jgi:ketosteroid isomerase-like protein
MAGSPTSLEEQPVRDALAALDDALERCDLDAVLKLSTEDVVFVDEAGEAFGRGAIGSMLASLAEDRLVLEPSITWESVEVDILGQIAPVLAWGPWRLTGLGEPLDGVRLAETGAAGSDELEYLLAELESDGLGGCRLTGVLVRVGDRWLWRLHHAGLSAEGLVSLRGPRRRFVRSGGWTKWPIRSP